MMASIAPRAPDRIGILDGFRAIAALSVVVWHYQHFFYDPMVGTISLHADRLPLRSFLGAFYDRGALAVDFFFVLSGYVFFTIYSKSIADREVRFREFAILRLTRLYPLHLLTFAVVALLQQFYFFGTGTYFVFQDQSWTSAFWNILFVGTGSFNAPVWSISVELVLYAVFFATCWLRLDGSRFNFVVMVCAAVFSIRFPYAGALASFFLGGLCARLVRWVLAGTPLRTRNCIFLGCLALTSGVIWLFVDTSWQLKTFEPIARALTVTLGRHVSPENIVNKTFSLTLEAVVFPSLVLLGALSEKIFEGTQLPWLVAFGNSTYAVYLCHFPVQIFVSTIVRALGLDTNIFYDWWVIAAYISSLPMVGIAVFYRFERPLQNWLRHRLLRKDGSAILRPNHH